MKSLIKKFFSAEFIRFAMVGVINTLVGAAIMFGAHNLFGVSTEISKILNYTLTSVMSFFLNKHFTFRNKGNMWPQIVRFALVIIACYLIADFLEIQIMTRLLIVQSEKWHNNLSMLVHMLIFIALNYTGQRFFAFREKRREESGNG